MRYNPYCFTVSDYESSATAKKLSKIVNESFSVCSDLGVLLDYSISNTEKNVLKYLITEDNIPSIAARYFINGRETSRFVPDYYFVRRATKKEIEEQIEMVKKEIESLTSNHKYDNFEIDNVYSDAKLFKKENYSQISLKNEVDMKEYKSRDWYTFLTEEEIDKNESKVYEENEDIIVGVLDKKRIVDNYKLFSQGFTEETRNILS